MSETSDLDAALVVLDLPSDAHQWLTDLYVVVNFFDDIADGDAPEDVQSALWKCLVHMPANPFFRAHVSTLAPVMATQIIKWEAANEVEASGEADCRSFMWRAGFYDVVAIVQHICGKSSPRAALSIYGESLDDYRKEFPCPPL